MYTILYILYHIAYFICDMYIYISSTILYICSIYYRWALWGIGIGITADNLRSHVKLLEKEYLQNVNHATLLVVPCLFEVETVDLG